MQYRPMLITLLALFLAACAPDRRGRGSGGDHGYPSAAAMSGVLGGWRADSPSYFNREKEILTISDDSVTVTKVCKNWWRSTAVSVTAPARVSGSHIEIIRPARAVSGPGQVPCEASIDAGLVAYQIDRNRLSFTPLFGRTYVYGKRRLERRSGWGYAGHHPHSSYGHTSHSFGPTEYHSPPNLGGLVSSWAESSGTSRRSTSRGSTHTVSNSHGTGVKRDSKRTPGVRSSGSRGHSGVSRSSTARGSSGSRTTSSSRRSSGSRGPSGRGSRGR